MKKNLFLFGVSLIFISCGSPTSEKYSNSEIDSAVISENTILADIQKEIAEEKKIPVHLRVKKLYKELNDKTYSLSNHFHEFDIILEETQGTGLEERVKKTRDSLEQIMKKNESERSSNERKQYGKDFENLLLDRELNIKVIVSGKDNRKITLKYVLFDEVWRRKFETEGYFDMLHDKGFDKICLTDGYRYQECWNYK